MSIRLISLIVVPVAVSVVTTPAAQSALNNPVRIETGLVAGVSTGMATSFKGIPFAAPPVGELRWREPRPAAAWQGVRRADQFSAACVQRKSGAFGPWSAEFIARNAMEGGSSEDCLYLNVWTAAAKAGEKRPVLVWIYGGGFTSGSGDVPVYDGTGLASKGMVMVTFNYRVGVFGFLAHPELTKESAHGASGNYALLDMIAALQWVRRNIAAFGGDPGNVTIAGQSAGAFGVNYLMASPVANGLFERAIAESGAAMTPVASLKEAEAAGVKLGESLGAKSIAELRSKPAEVLLQGSGAYRDGPVADGYVVPTDVRTIFEHGHQNDVPLLIGWNADDGVSFAAPLKADAFRAQAQRTYGDFAGDFLKAYPAGTDDEAAKSQHAVGRDSFFAWQGRLWAREQSKTGKSKVFLYFFDRTAPGTEAETKFGAFHSGEIGYALGSLAKWDRPWTDVDRKLEDEMSSYWVNFAKTGDPNGRGLPKWPAFTSGDERALRLGEKIEAIPVPDKAGLDFFDEANGRK